jgi:hypothetical protein
MHDGRAHIVVAMRGGVCVLPVMVVIAMIVVLLVVMRALMAMPVLAMLVFLLKPAAGGP